MFLHMYKLRNSKTGKNKKNYPICLTPLMELKTRKLGIWYISKFINTSVVFLRSKNTFTWKGMLKFDISYLATRPWKWSKIYDSRGELIMVYHYWIDLDEKL